MDTEDAVVTGQMWDLLVELRLELAEEKVLTAKFMKKYDALADYLCRMGLEPPKSE